MPARSVRSRPRDLRASGIRSACAIALVGTAWASAATARDASVASAPSASVAPAGGPRASSSTAHLGLVLVPPDATASPSTRDTFAVIVSGDGGWRPLERGIAAQLASRGIPVLGWSSLRYFWRARTADEASADLARVIDAGRAATSRSRVLLVGFSQGADTLPFMVNRLVPELRERIALLALLAPGAEAFFEFHLTHWFRTPRGGVPVRPEIARLPGPVLCLYGRSDEDALCHDGAFTHVRALPMDGGHDFDGRDAAVAGEILDALAAAATTPWR